MKNQFVAKDLYRFLIREAYHLQDWPILTSYDEIDWNWDRIDDRMHRPWKIHCHCQDLIDYPMTDWI